MSRVREIVRCAWWLLAVSVAMLASGVQLEMLSGESRWWIWIHVVAGCVFFGLIIWHVFLHYRWNDWEARLCRQGSANTRWLAAVGVLTLFTGLWTTAVWIADPVHGKLGAVHGKLGFLMLVLAGWHAARRARFYRSRKNK